ncbi:MAG: RrF2 family transcriptional regulator [Anaerotruncus massiliensis (ex Togo et al. 2019)]
MTSEFAIAVHALVYLNHKGETVSSEALAENICTNPARVRKVMAKLKKAGLVATKEGVDGGYHFIKAPAEVTLRRIDEAVDVRLVSACWKPGDREKACLVASGMGDIWTTSIPTSTSSAAWGDHHRGHRPKIFDQHELKKAFLEAV